MPIGLVARLTGLRASALRYYESEGLIAPVRRVRGRRRFDRAVLDRLTIVAAAQQSGFTIAEVKTLLAGMDADELPASWRSMAAQKLVDLESDMRRLEAMHKMLHLALACGCADADACLRIIRAT